MSDQHGPFKDALDNLKRWSKVLADMTEPVAYFVLDHAIPTFSHIDDVDAAGRRYMQVNPSVLDAMAHRRLEEDWRFDTRPLGSLTGVPVYKREDMAEGWPDA